VTLVQPGNVRTDFTSSRRDVAAAPGDNPYGAQAERAVRVMERDEARGAAPESVAATIQRVLEAKRPPRRVTVGKLQERAGVFAKRLLPYRVFEQAAKSSLGV
jgi:short-subunit dehydrogenase